MREGACVLKGREECSKTTVKAMPHFGDGTHQVGKDIQEYTVPEPVHQDAILSTLAAFPEGSMRFFITTIQTHR